MRKILLSLLFSCFGIYAIGQNAVPVQKLNRVSPSEISAFKAPSSKAYTHWFDNLDEAKSTGFENYVLFNSSLFSDSTVKTLYGDGNGGTVLGYVSTQGIGEVFDPKSNMYDTFLSRYNPFTIDSVGLPYEYNYVKEYGPKDPITGDSTVHDTLIFQFYSQSSGGIVTGTFPATPPNFPTSEFYALTKYNYQKNLGTLNTGSTVRYVMSAKDSQSTVKNLINVATNGASGLKLQKNDLFAWTLSYRPGFKYKLGDTIDEKNSVKPKHLHSHFKYLLGQTAAKDANSDYEMSLTIPTTVRYNKNTNGWNAQFIPGSAWLNSNQIIWSFVHATTPNLGIEKSGDIKGYGLSNIYPNPSHGTAKFDFALGQTENVTVAVYDMVGHQVATLVNGQYGQGSHTISFSTANYKTGIYLYSITAGSYSKTLKFTVTE